LKSGLEQKLVNTYNEEIN